jgi:hypothetical protein
MKGYYMVKNIAVVFTLFLSGCGVSDKWHPVVDEQTSYYAPWVIEMDLTECRDVAINAGSLDRWASDTYKISYSECMKNRGHRILNGVSKLE